VEGKQQELAELLAIVDQKIMDSIIAEPTGLVMGLYLYLDDPFKPLSGREFVEFWASLNFFEKHFYLNPRSRYTALPPITPEELEALDKVAWGMFRERTES
jgi:hypothetical protein